jgi:hypothetical protein
MPSNITTTAVVTEAASPGSGMAVLIGLGIALGVVLLVAAGIIYYLTRQMNNMKKAHEEEIGNISASSSSTVEENPYRVSYMPGSSVPTVVAPSSHVPSMQEFAQFKAMYSNVLAFQAVQEMSQNGQPYSELEGTTTAASTRHQTPSLPPPPPPADQPPIHYYPGQDPRTPASGAP